jgi:Protein of unknown function (DUF3499)
VDGTPNCSRLGCCEPAVAVFAFDARASLVWLDPVSTPGRGAGVLCQAHADGLSPPRGWNLLDRRAAESRLWTGRPAVATWAPHAPRRDRPARSRPCAPTALSLPFESVEPAPPVEVPREPEPTTWSPHDRPGPEFEHVLDARTPLLARAFEAARPTDDA